MYFWVLQGNFIVCFKRTRLFIAIHLHIFFFSCRVWVVLAFLFSLGHLHLLVIICHNLNGKEYYKDPWLGRNLLHYFLFILQLFLKIIDKSKECRQSPVLFMCPTWKSYKLLITSYHQKLQKKCCTSVTVGQQEQSWCERSATPVW